MKLAIIINSFEEKYVHQLKGLFSTSQVKVLSKPINTISHLRLYCEREGIDAVLTTQLSLIKKLSSNEKATLDSYAGSMFKVPRSNETTNLNLTDLDSMEVVCLNDLSMLFKVNYTRFLFGRWINKLTHPQNWLLPNKFKYSLIDLSHESDLIAEFSKATFVAVDIETTQDLTIRCCAYTTVHLIGDEVILNNYTLPLTSLDNVKLMRRLNAHPVAKALQNGKYDSAYFYLYAAPLTNYMWDTINMHHAWYAELPKDLASLAAFYVRDFCYWKGAHNSTNLSELYEYNAKDTYVTALAALAWIKEAPDWAKYNYLIKFPTVFPAHLAEMTGIALDKTRMAELKKEKETKIQELNTRLDKWLNVDNFNVASPKQMKELLKLLGIRDAKSADAKTLVAVSAKHPLNAVIIDAITAIRKERKLVSTYLKDTIAIQNPLLLKGLKRPRMLYSLNPHGTETGRLASKEHHFWCGLNIQNIPRGGRIKEIAIADDDFLLGENDFAQAESRGTGYITGQQNLIDILESDKDFHKYNASAFFGVPYEQVDKPLRQLSKPVNHGANYNMGAYILIQQMGGELAVLKAGKMLGLPPSYPAEKIANHLLDSFDKAYPRIRNEYHGWVKYKVATTKKLVGATGWTRYCFGNPTKNKLDLNALVAHNPQSLNAMILDKAFIKVFETIWLREPENFLMCAQIHDSILYQYRKGHEHLADEVAELMTMPIEVTDIMDVTRTMIVPADVTAGLTRWGDKSD